MKKLVVFLKYQFRYKLSSVYIILGMVIGFVALYNGIGIYQYIKKYTNDLRGNSYEYSAEVQLAHTEPFSVQSYIYEVDSVVRMDNVDVYVDAQEIACKLTVLLSHREEEPNYHMVEGRLPNEEEIAGKERVVAVGRGRKEAVYYKNETGYIMLNGEEYRVTGIIGTKASDAQDYLIITYYDCLGEKILESIDPYGYVLVIESDLLDVEGACEGISSLAAVSGITVQYSNTIRNISGMTREEKDTMNMYILIFGFAILSCVIIAKFWIYERKRDIAILRIIGFDKEKIILKLTKDMLFHIVCSVVISAVIQTFLYIFIIDKMIYEISILSFLLMVVLAILISFVIIISPVLKIMNNPPVYEINGRCVE